MRRSVNFIHQSRARGTRLTCLQLSHVTVADSRSECDFSRAATLLEQILFPVNQIGNESLNEVVVDLLDLLVRT